jgi:protein-L-isoaspartate(D-aspartate) O-methyltransferase
MKPSDEPAQRQRQPSAFDARLLEAVDAFPRRLFAPAGVNAQASSGEPIRLGAGTTIPPVDVVKMMLSALELHGTERVLDIGCGSGYQTALLSRLAREVVSVEIDEARAKRAARVLNGLGCRNVRVVNGDGSGGWREGAPYQGIIVGAAATELPSALLEQLDLGGRLVVALGDMDSQLVECMRKRVDGLDSRTIGACHLDMLASAQRTRSFFPWTKKDESEPMAAKANTISEPRK